jgi:hypothetical protein
VVWAFDIGKAVDADGGEIVPDPENLTEGLFVQPEPFPAKIVPRDPGRVERILAEWEKMKKLLDENAQWRNVPEGIF